MVTALCLIVNVTCQKTVSISKLGASWFSLKIQNMAKIMDNISFQYNFVLLEIFNYYTCSAILVFSSS